jgi:hypothetical protein
MRDLQEINYDAVAAQQAKELEDRLRLSGA